MKTKLLILLFVAFAPMLSFGQDPYLHHADSLKSSLVQGFGMPLNSFGIFNGNIYGLRNDTIWVLDTREGVFTDTLCLPDTLYEGYGSFLTLSPDGDQIWVGFTTWDNSDDRIYRVDPESGEWEHIADLPANFDLAFYKGIPLVSGLNSSNWSAPNGIWILDTTGQNNHRLLIQTGGYSSGLDTDKDGNLYYGTNLLTDNAIYVWIAKVVQSAIDTDSGTLSFKNGLHLTSVPAGTYDVAVDTGGHVVFNCNNFETNFIGLWNGSFGNENNFDTVATSTQYLTYLGTEGLVTKKDSGNHIYALAYMNPLTEIHGDFPPYVKNILDDIRIPSSDTITHTINLLDLFADDDDADSVFSFSLDYNSDPDLLDVSISENFLQFRLMKDNPGQTDIVIRGTTHYYSAVLDTLSIFVIYPVGTADPNTLPGVQVYPNPFTDRIFIKGARYPLETEITGMSGNVIYRGVLNAEYPLDMSRLQAGTYLLRIRDALHKETHQIIIKR